MDGNNANNADNVASNADKNTAKNKEAVGTVTVQGSSLPIFVRVFCLGKIGGLSRSSKARTAWQVMTFLLTYWIYAVYTLTRRPFSVIKIALCPTCAKEDNADIMGNSSDYPNMTDQQILGWPPFNSTNGKTLLGSMDYTLIFSYSVALFFSGYVADRVNLRYFITIGLAGSGLAAFMQGIGYFAQVHHLAFFIVFQILAGFMQSTGWPGLLGITAKWFGKKNRGLVMGLWSSCSFVGSILGYVVPSFFIHSQEPENSPWGWSFITPSLIALATATAAFFLLVPDPEYLHFEPVKQAIETEAAAKSLQQESSRSAKMANNGRVDGLGEVEGEGSDESSTSTRSEGWTEPSTPVEGQVHEKSKAVGCLQALLIPGVVEYSLALFFNKFITYAFNFWLPFYNSVTYNGLGGRNSAWIATLFDIGAIIGALSIGIVSDKLLSARAVLIVPMLLIGVPVLYIFRVFGDVSLVFYSVFIFLLGLFINGPHIIIAGTVANDLGTHHSLKNNQHAKSVVSGIIDGTGTLGAAIGPLVVGVVSDKLGWDILFYILMSACFTSAIFLLRLLVKDVRRIVKRYRSNPSSRQYATTNPLSLEPDVTRMESDVTRMESEINGTSKLDENENDFVLFETGL